jgi:hypothetical protein
MQSGIVFSLHFLLLANEGTGLCFKLFWSEPGVIGIEVFYNHVMPAYRQGRVEFN